MLSNRIWSVPAVDRAAAPGTLTAYFRCGSQQGKPARSVDAAITQDELDALTVEFLATEIDTFRKALASRQKNASRNLKKCLDGGDIRTVEQQPDISPATLAADLL